MDLVLRFSCVLSYPSISCQSTCQIQLVPRIFAILSKLHQYNFASKFWTVEIRIWYITINASIFIWINDFLSYLEWSIVTQIEEMLPHDITVNKMLSKFGAEHILGLFNDQPVIILTHCNTGSLATAGYGTALGKHGHRTNKSISAPTASLTFFNSLNADVKFHEIPNCSINGL